MARRKLTSFEIKSFVEENCYPVDKDFWFFSRCIDGRYEKKIKNQKSKIKNLEPLAKPGADIGDLMMVFSANNEYGLLIEEEKIFEAVLKTVSGWKNLRFHTDKHSFDKHIADRNLLISELASPPNRRGPLARLTASNRGDSARSLAQTSTDDANFVSLVDIFLGCGHYKQAAKDPLAYGLVEEEIKVINKFLKEAKKKGARCEILEGEHLESAVLIVKGGGWSVSPKLIMKEFNNEIIEVFVYQKTLDDKRRKILAKNLLPYVKAPFSVEEEYLYEVLSQVADNQLLETLSRLAKDLPMYEVKFEEDGGFEIRQV